MIIPIRCFTCGKVLANKWNHYQTMLESEYSESAALEALGITRYCCRRMLISHVDFIQKILTFAPQVSTGISIEYSGPSIFRNIYNESSTSLSSFNSPRYEPESSRSSDENLSNRTYRITPGNLLDNGSPRYVSDESSPRYSQNDDTSPRYVSGESSPRYFQNDDSYLNSGQINPVYGLNSDDHSLSSLRQEPRQEIPDSPTYQSASVGEYEQENDYLSQNLPKQDQAYGDESPRYSPDY
ncbi:uncharacterized protein OCT59_027372 [Rhizophagus irregularis]|uniref:DNA-directed RNA polymerases I, II, and III subunit RPABC5 n=2 Tax=Rhizophagus irregularis TaxID=588596 RepID=A0A015JH07_RHIIW|nr:hypothetical protein GLOIN_2v1874480 [Rhizophagus irregularis DAOM 181602=DAOM 197198]EXX54179.1 Rpb10p [Rhizophagus irregularis DAOM 197198w]POG73383.1 hypothetical protein GLOIN_2v1874480 [Rhizophagus irregularis DAOM 181602=DAOM 197198]UZO07069.1 hypothetical protein OCT59_027372 [Rhizophagus irregularis]GBC45083.1 DNA-directed RNA polymerases I, II, and III subunit RPABC5 [Rhizophagus irregularis DAOM 181602=DAOM 197198]|eukprot:XP_025180249.1 hypothetical protein GLOIN_2v1874480 [Rhizophagus irregularis DAOM 181602=DAOM 197198]